MSKTLNYSLLLLKSSPGLQAKILSRLDSGQQLLLKEKLQSVPLVGLEKLRQMKDQLCEEMAPQSAVMQLQPAAGLISHDDRQDGADARMIDLMISSEVFEVQTRQEASAYLECLDDTAIQLLQSYLDSANSKECCDE
ncbi:hypothetical protein L4174_006430 [Photobacterium sp. CCB-ST2H9]|uniref:hypothetical protein n=1 Tax=Photobacterium sp. CCB-ST2H9 TaxID=2912855 RepID=UPI00200414FB|nr:hypothetical protein [Photobacterium sp. CCB-ST2H9]UTM58472.1 hypothetical protein L4174_006430 [Photobacterium sp. CCB-ST2H9]